MGSKMGVDRLKKFLFLPGNEPKFLRISAPALSLHPLYCPSCSTFHYN